MIQFKRVLAILLFMTTLVTALPVEVTATQEDTGTEVVECTEIIETTETLKNTELKENIKAGIEEEYLIEYLVVNESNVEIGSNQQIVLGIGCDKIIEEAVLQYHNRETGEAFEQYFAEYLDGALLFEILFENENQAGTYQLDSVTFKVEEKFYTEYFSEAEIEAVFGVNREITPEPDAIIDDGTMDESEVEMDIVRIDENGNTISETSLESAIENANACRPSLYSEERSENIVVVLDPGHDNTHAGAQANDLGEEDLNIKIAAYCKEELEQYKGLTVYLTRKLDGSCPYPGTTASECNEKRIEYAQSVGANIYVSLHNNSATNTSAHGGMVFYPNANYNPEISETGKGLAEKIQEQLVALGIYDRGITIKDSNDTLYPDGSTADYYAVIRNGKLAGIPAIIVEHTFISNVDDVNNFLVSDEKLKKLGVADATAIASYYGLSKSVNVTVGTVKVDEVNNSNGTAVMSALQVAPSDKLEKVSFAVWSKSDQSDLKWYDVKNDGTGNYKAVLDITNHKNNYTTYYVDAYAYDIYGNGHYIGGTICTFTMPTAQVSVIGNDAQTSYKVTATGVTAASGVKEVKVAVWSQKDDQDDLIWYQASKNSSGAYTVDVPIANHKTAGTYYADVYVVSNSNESKYIGSTTFEVAAPSAKNIEIANTNNDKGIFDVIVTGVQSKSGVRELQVKIWSKSDQSDLYLYTAEKQSDGTYIVQANIANHNYNYGTYYADVYAIAENGVCHCVGEKTVFLSAPKAKTVAKLNSAQTSCVVEVSCAGIQDVKSVRFAVWSQAGGQNDLVWYTAANADQGTWKADIEILNHKSSGLYYVDAYATNGAGNSLYIGGTTFKVAAVLVGEVEISNRNNAAGTFNVVVTDVKSPSGVSKIQVPVWSKSDSSDLYWYTAEKQSDGSYIAKVDIANHKFNYGTYYADVYVTAGNGVCQYAGGKKVTISVPQAATKAVANSNQTSYSLSASGVGLPGGVKSVRFAVWSQAGGQDDLVWYTAANAGSGTWEADIEILNHKTSGLYYVDTYATNGAGNSVYICGTTFKVAAVSIGKVEIANPNNATGTFDLVVTGVKSPSGVSKVQVPVWSKSDSSDLYWYMAEKQSDGSYIAKVDIANHKYNYGTYYADVYVTAGNGVFQYVGGKKITISVPKAVTMATTSSNQMSCSIAASGVGLPGGVKSVRFAVWSQVNGQDDLVWYTAANAGSGTWKTDMKIATHKTAGLYYVDTYATNGAGSSVYLGGTTFKVEGPSVSKVELVNYNEADGTFGVQASGVNSLAGIASVKVAVWTSGNQSDLLWYDATKVSEGTYRVGADIRNHQNNTGKYYADVYITDNNGIRIYAGGITCLIVNVTNILHPLMGSNSVTIAQMAKYFNSYAAYPSFYTNTEAPTIEDFCSIYLEECRIEGVKAEVAFCQAMKETGFLKFGGNVSITQFNFAGIGSTGAGVAGESYPDVRTGIRAQIQHLKAYGCSEPLNQSCVDTRFTYVTRNTAPYVEWLGIQENPYRKGWAAAKNYGYDIVSMVNKLKMN